MFLNNIVFLCIGDSIWKVASMMLSSGSDSERLMEKFEMFQLGEVPRYRVAGLNKQYAI